MGQSQEVHGRDALGHDDLRDVGETTQPLPDAGVSRHIDRARRVIENQDTRAPHKRPGDAESLTLATADAIASLAEVGIKATDSVKELVNGSDMTRLQQLLVRSIRTTPEKVLAHRTGEEHGALERDAHALSQRGDVVLAHVMTTDKNGAVRHVIQARKQLDERALARPRAAKDAYRRTRRERERDVMKDVCGGIGVVLEARMTQLDGAIRNLRDRVLRARDRR